MTETPHESGHTTATDDRGPRVSAEQMRDIKRLRRSATDRKIAGVAGGIARHLDVDPTLVRVVLVVLAFFGGAGLVIYGTCWLLIPEEGTDDAPIRATTEVRTVAVVAALVLAAVLLLGNGWWFGFGSGWPAPLPLLVVVGLVVFLVLRNRDNRPARAAPPTSPSSPGSPASGPPGGPATVRRPPKGKSLFGLTMAVVLLALGVVAVVEVAITPLPWAIYPAAALAVIGVALVVGAFVGRGSGLTLMGLLASAVLAIAVWAPELRIGDVVEHPTSAAQLQDHYAYTAGRIRLDLTDIDNLGQLDGRLLDLSMRAGQIVVELPEGLDVAVTSQAQGGQLVMLGEVTEGSSIRNDRAAPDTTAPDLRVNIDLGFGHARVSTP